MDVTLAQQLLDVSHGGETVIATQQQLASELGTAREVVGRLMAEFQRQGWISTTRGTLVINDRDQLQALAGRSE